MEHITEYNSNDVYLAYILFYVMCFMKKYE